MSNIPSSQPASLLNEGGRLCTAEQAARLVSQLACQSSTLALEVREDKCFKDEKWLSVGEVRLFPTPIDFEFSELDDESQLQEAKKNAFYNAVQNGQYRWATLDADSLKQSISKVMPGLDEKANKEVLQAVTEALQDISRRLGLILPCFALDAVREWPYRRPATWVLDTSAVIQGALDFAWRFLFPMVRLRVPAVVSVEIQNLCDRFLTMRRDAKLETDSSRKVRCLKEHLKSQGAQRGLMRMEWHSGVEVERATVGVDPLRFVFQNDKEVNDLNLTQIQRSLADRLIFETAKEHRSRLSHGQPVHIVTSDQGLARMSLSEGMSPIYFDARRSCPIIGRQLSGILFHPFTSGLHTVSLVEFLWEMATCFGSARLRIEGQNDKKSEFEAVAISQTLDWSPDHVRENLFYCRWSLSLEDESVTPVEIASPEDGLPPTNKLSVELSADNETKTVNPVPTKVKPATALIGIGGYMINVERLLRLVDELGERGQMSEAQMIEILKVNQHSSFKEYRTFLASGGFVGLTPQGLKKTLTLDALREVIAHQDLDRLRQLLMQVPTFRVFMEYVETQGRRPDWQKAYPVRPKAVPAYRQLAEISACALVIPDRGICATLKHPSGREFAVIALRRYEELARTDPWILTGQWLEAIAWDEGIHPVVTRQLLESVCKDGLINRYFEGSTPDTGFDSHFVHELEMEQEKPVIKKSYLYRGDFLWSERPSVRLSLERRD